MVITITAASIKKLSTPEKGIKIYFDSQLKGFGVRVTSNGTKSFIVQKRQGYLIKSTTIARCNEITVEVARKEAAKILGKLALGQDLAPAKRTITLKEAFDYYLKSRQNLKPNTIYQYTQILNSSLIEWKNKSLSVITRQMVLDKHQQLTESAGPASANVALQIVKVVYNFYIAMNEHVKLTNPVNVLTITKSWKKIPIRKGCIKKQELKAWFEALSCCSDTVRDYLLFLLFTGTRRQEAATLLWDQVDFKKRTIIIDPINKTKNGEVHEIPMTDYLYKLLFYRERTNEYVFPGKGKASYVTDPRISIQKITKISGVKFIIHDLRRTFTTIADSLDIPSYVIKRLLNHKSKQDVTTGYIVDDVERLREPLEKISRYIQENII